MLPWYEHTSFGKISVAYTEEEEEEEEEEKQYDKKKKKKEPTRQQVALGSRLSTIVL